MGHSIFDWDDENDKKEDEREQSFQPPAFVDDRPERVPESTPWNDPWQPVSPEDDRAETNWEQPAPENQWAEEPWRPEQDRSVEVTSEYVPYKPQSADESTRRGGLAWSAGIVFFSSIVFMLFVGWGADWVFQSSPWGIVAGIVLGSIIGFVQFFRISSQIFNPRKSEFRPLMPRDDEDR
jgi:F0F1-type ATP synthase assembly protein I